MELCDGENEKKKCTVCIDDWRYLCRSQRNCDFGSGDDDYDNPRHQPLWCCVCWCVSCCLLCPNALWSTLVACVYAVCRSFRACFIVLLCGVCYLCADYECDYHASCCCSQRQTSGIPADHEKNSADHPTKAEDIA